MLKNVRLYDGNGLILLDMKQSCVNFHINYLKTKTRFYSLRIRTATRSFLRGRDRTVVPEFSAVSLEEAFLTANKSVEVNLRIEYCPNGT